MSLPKLSKLRKQYNDLKRLWLKSNTACAKCRRRGRVEVHHKCGRLGPLLTFVELWIPLCGRCHRWVHANPAAAQRAGLLAELGDWNNTKLTKVNT